MGIVTPTSSAAEELSKIIHIKWMAIVISRHPWAIHKSQVSKPVVLSLLTRKESWENSLIHQISAAGLPGADIILVCLDIFRGHPVRETSP